MLRRQTPSAVLEVRGVVKDFPGTRALDDVDLAVRRGEVHALLGENGGRQVDADPGHLRAASRPTAGAIFVGGQLVEFASPQQAQALGIAVVHQHFNLATQLSVAENLFLSRSLPRRAGIFVNWGETRRQAEKLLERVGLKIDPMTEVSSYGPMKARWSRSPRRSAAMRKSSYRRTDLGAIARGSVDPVRAYAAPRVRGPFVSLRQPPAGGSVRDRGSGHGLARRKRAGLARERSCRVGRSSGR